MLDIEEIREKMKDRNITKVAAKIGVSRPHLSTILNDKNTNPTYNIMKKLSEYLQQ